MRRVHWCGRIGGGVAGVCLSALAALVCAGGGVTAGAEAQQQQHQADSTPARTGSREIAWNPAWDNTLGRAAAPARAAVAGPLVREDGVLKRDGREFIFFGTNLTEASTAMDTDEKIRKTLERIASEGFNSVRLMGMDSKHMEASTNYGCWAGTSGPEFSETFMVRLDKTIAVANSLGLQVWITFNHPDQVVRRAGLPTGTYKAYGMGWSGQFRAIYKAHIARFANRVNTQTGVSYIDNPGIVWQPENENGFSDAYFNHGPTGGFDGVRWFDQIVDQTNGNGYWKRELDTKIRGYYAGKGWVLPGGQFPKWSTWNGWTDAADKEHLVRFVADTDLEYASELYRWFKSLNPHVLVNTNTFDYMDSRTLGVTDIAARNSYARTASGDAIGTPPNYRTRPSILRDANGWNWSWVMGGSRTEDVPLVLTEVGDYGLNRWDYERTILEAIVGCLQKTSGFFVFNESQDLRQATGSGITYIHSHVGWPSRRLAVMLARPIVEHRLIAPLPEKNVAVIDPGEWLAGSGRARVAGVNSYSFQNGWDGSERGYWLKRLYMRLGRPQDTSGYPKLTDAEFRAGVQVTKQVLVKETGVRVNAPGVVGLVNDLKDTTIGPMTLSGVTPTENAVVMIRSDGDYPLFAGPAKLFVHQYSTVTDARGFAGAADGETVTGWGSPGNTRLVVPAPFVVTLATGGKPVEVCGVKDDGTVTAMDVAFDPAKGTARFCTDARFPLYLVNPRQP